MSDLARLGRRRNVRFWAGRQVPLLAHSRTNPSRPRRPDQETGTSEPRRASRGDRTAGPGPRRVGLQTNGRQDPGEGAFQADQARSAWPQSRQLSLRGSPSIRARVRASVGPARCIRGLLRLHPATTITFGGVPYRSGGCRGAWPIRVAGNARVARLPTISHGQSVTAVRGRYQPDGLTLHRSICCPHPLCPGSAGAAVNRKAFEWRSTARHNHSGPLGIVPIATNSLRRY